jgi:hypothetical protein
MTAPRPRKRPGYLERHATPQELADLQAAQQRGLEDEIGMLRIAMRRFFALAGGCDDLEAAGQILKTIGMAASRLALLLKPRDGSETDDGKVEAAISNAIADVVREFGIHK